jgi:hypothetical protein
MQYNDPVNIPDLSHSLDSKEVPREEITRSLDSRVLDPAIDILLCCM